MTALIITDPSGSVPPIEVPNGAEIVIHRGLDCLYISQEVKSAGKLQGYAKELCSVPVDVRIKVVS